jgi:hypothetical protein
MWLKKRGLPGEMRTRASFKKQGKPGPGTRNSGSERRVPGSWQEPGGRKQEQEGREPRATQRRRRTDCGASGGENGPRLVARWCQ